MTELHYQQDDITLRDLLLKGKEFFFELLRYWWFILLITIPFVSYYLYEAFEVPPLYTAALSFTLNDNSSVAKISFNPLAQFTGESSNPGLDRMLKIAKSRHLVQQVLFQKQELYDTTDFIANHYITAYNLYEEEWEDNERLQDFIFEHDTIAVFDRGEASVLKGMHGAITSQYLESKPGEGGVVELVFTSEEEEFAIMFLNTFFENLNSYYINQTIEKQLYDLNLMTKRADSINNAVASHEVRLANFKDENRGLFKSKDQLKKARIERSLRRLYIMQEQVIRNLERLKFSLQDKTPFIQIIDAPLAPLGVTYESKTKALVIGAFIGLFLSCSLILGRKIVVDALEKEEEEVE